MIFLFGTLRFPQPTFITLAAVKHMVALLDYIVKFIALLKMYTYCCYKKVQVEHNKGIALKVLYTYKIVVLCQWSTV